MLNILAPSLTLLVAVLGVFFSKGGERNKVRRVGYIILSLIVVSGCGTIYQAILGLNTAASLSSMVSQTRMELSETKSSLLEANSRLTVSLEATMNELTGTKAELGEAR